ncbi:restriction endonuclease [Dictyobacter formicarum]|uniref:Restriction endonuclease type IV Mrr domain-containing protein n=1 Tax=Dictyobacter formicarum TaxID=2778368 RepID=A0ABQ3VGB7_9CHLR|nr:hypothetical protein [Dictyobacter formicarum]GHO85229.1 hypothetical protein KSZ_32350 [Dictyobacter formicarum]
MADWDMLIAESKKLEETASQIQQGETIGLPQEAIRQLSYDYQVWLSKCLSVLPQDLKDKFRSDYEGSFLVAKIKKFLESATEPFPFYTKDENGKQFFSYWTYPYQQNFYPYINSQRQLLLEAKEREQNQAFSPEEIADNAWNKTIQRIFKVFIEKAENAKTNHEKKLTYEYLGIFLIGAIDGLTVIGHDERGVSEEIDLWVSNESTHPFWQRIPAAFIVECKNWGAPIGVPELRTLSAIMSDKNIPFSILLTKNGITGDRNHDAGDIIRNAFRDKKYILVLTQADLLEIANGMHPTEKIKQKYFDLTMSS